MLAEVKYSTHLKKKLHLSFLDTSTRVDAAACTGTINILVETIATAQGAIQL